MTNLPMERSRTQTPGAVNPAAPACTGGTGGTGGTGRGRIAGPTRTP